MKNSHQIRIAFRSLLAQHNSNQLNGIEGQTAKVIKNLYESLDQLNPNMIFYFLNGGKTIRNNKI
jgi:hypothetical protein